MADRRRDRDNKERDGVSRARVIATARVAHASRVLAIASRDRGISGRLFLQDTKTNTRGPTRTGVACATQTKKLRTVFLHFKSSCFERRTGGRAVRSTLILLFAKKFFRGPSRTGGFRNRFTAKTQTHEVRIWVQRHAGE